VPYEGEENKPSHTPKLNSINTLVKKHKLNIYKALARPVLAYGSENWRIRKTDEKRSSASENKLDHTRNT
jgi:hypothetical protein